MTNATEPIPNTEMSDELVLRFTDPAAERISLTGGKGASLAAMARAGLPVPPGLCVTTAGFERFMSGHPRAEELMAILDAVDTGDLAAVTRAGQQVRDELARTPVPEDVRDAVLAGFAELGEQHPYAVRSSATLEDLPDASFAGQQDTYLEIRGADALIDHVRRCWISLFTDRAIVYRRNHGYGSTQARLSVVVQRMIAPQISGIMFTADPLTGHRGICSIDASYGLGEALVSGLVTADLYRARKADGQIIEVRIGDKAVAIEPLPGGGTETVPVSEERRAARALDDHDVQRLVDLGVTVEQHRGPAQDIEWAMAGKTLYLLQARPITTLFPLPRPAPSDGALHVYLSFGHLQVNTAALSPMSSSMFAHAVPAAKPSPSEPSQLFARAGNRIYVDLSTALRRRWFASVLVRMIDNMVDASLARRVQAVIDRPEFAAGNGAKTPLWPLIRFVASLARRGLGRLLSRDVEQARLQLEAAMQHMRGQFELRLDAAEPGAAKVKVVREGLDKVISEIVLGLSAPAVMAGMLSWKLLARFMRGRVEPHVVDEITRGLAGNVTTEMDLELGDLADLVRANPALAERLQQARVPGQPLGAELLREDERVTASLQRFLDQYGCRGAGEIDIALPRWGDDPAPLLMMLAGMLSGTEPGAHRRRHAAAVRSSEDACRQIIDAAGRGGALAWLLGPLRRRRARALITRARAYLSLREHHKFLITQIYYHARQVLLESGRIAVERGILANPDDVWMLDLNELIAALEAPQPASLHELVQRRRAEHARAAELSPPVVLTSEGEAPAAPAAGAGGEPLPEGALAGLSVSGGVIEGVARVIRDPAREMLSHGEILVAPFTDPGWTPLFMHAGGLVMEVGGLMTHGSVVAREVGIPAVVAVDRATTKIRTGQRIRVDADRGYVMVLEPEPAAAEVPDNAAVAMPAGAQAEIA